MKQLICIVCPKGCHLSVDEKDFSVTGNGCPRGAEYGAQELRDPRRTLTTTVILKGAARCRLPVRTDRPVRKDEMMTCMRALDGVEVNAPVKMGDVIVGNVADSGANIVACCDMPAGKK